MDDLVASSTIVTPYMIQCNSKQHFIAVEKAIYCEVKSFTQSLIVIMALYYVFDLAYPNACKNTLLFLEKFIFDIKTGPPLSKAALAAITDISNTQ